MQITVIEDFVSKEYQDHLEKLILELPLFFNLHTVDLAKKESLKNNKLTIDCPQFTHVFVAEGNSCSNHWNHIEPIVFNFLATSGMIGGMQLVKCKLNLNLTTNLHNQDQHFVPHVDMYGAKGLTAIYYIKDSDGDTLFFNDKMKVIKRVTPKKGMLVCFDNSIYHAGQPPKNYPVRALINFNWVY